MGSHWSKEAGEGGGLAHNTNAGGATIAEPVPQKTNIYNQNRIPCVEGLHSARAITVQNRFRSGGISERSEDNTV